MVRVSAPGKQIHRPATFFFLCLLRTRRATEQTLYLRLYTILCWPLVVFTWSNERQEGNTTFEYRRQSFYVANWALVSLCRPLLQLSPRHPFLTSSADESLVQPCSTFPAFAACLQDGFDTRCACRRSCFSVLRFRLRRTSTGFGSTDTKWPRPQASSQLPRQRQPGPTKVEAKTNEARKEYHGGIFGRRTSSRHRSAVGIQGHHHDC